MGESNIEHNPCDDCIEFECENHGVVCPFYKEEKDNLKNKLKEAENEY